MLCPECGATNKGNANFCEACGKPVSSPADQISTMTESVAAKKPISAVGKALIGVVIVGIIVVVVAVVALGPQGFTDKLKSAGSAGVTIATPDNFVSKIAFVRDNDIWTMEVDKYGKAVPNSEVQITKTPVDEERSPSWSNDGKKLVYVVDSETKSGNGAQLTTVVITDAEGQNAKNVISNNDLKEPYAYFDTAKWMSDDINLMMSVQSGGKVFWIWITEADTGKLTKSVGLTYKGFDIDSSGKLVTCQGHTYEGQITANGSYFSIFYKEDYLSNAEATQITPDVIYEDRQNGPNYGSPIWVTDKTFYVSEEKDGFSELIEMDTNGEKVRTILEGDWINPSLSKDGKSVVAEAIVQNDTTQPAVSSIWTVDVKTGAKNKITDNASEPSWSHGLYIKKIKK